MKLAVRAEETLRDLEKNGTRKVERVLLSPQANKIVAKGTKLNAEVINLCANNYLGLADDPRLINAAKSALDTHGFGMASVRFICGTQDLHRKLEKRTAKFLRKEDAIVFPSCFDANGGLFEAILNENDAVISDALNHASIIDGVRLCKAKRFRYKNNDIGDLEKQLIDAQGCHTRLIVTDGVFSMDGIIAKLDAICRLAETYDASVMVDDCHGTGVLGNQGAGVAQMLGVEDHVTILSGTYGKALGGASGGYIAGPKAIVELLRNRARPYLFSNALPPAICAAALTAIDIAEAADQERKKLKKLARHFRNRMQDEGFELIDGNHPIIPIMVGDAALAAKIADALLDYGLYVVAFSFPVVPKGTARIRTQISAAHSFKQMDQAVDAFVAVGKKFGLIK